MEVVIPEPALVVESRQDNGSAPDWEYSYSVRVLCGSTVVFERTYYEHGEESVYDPEDAKDKALSEFGAKLKALMGEP